MAYPFRRKCDIPHMTETTQRKTGADSRIQDKLTLHNPALLPTTFTGNCPCNENFLNLGICVPYVCGVRLFFFFIISINKDIINTYIPSYKILLHLSLKRSGTKQTMRLWYYQIYTLTPDNSQILKLRPSSRCRTETICRHSDGHVSNALALCCTGITPYFTRRSVHGYLVTGL